MFAMMSQNSQVFASCKRVRIGKCNRRKKVRRLKCDDARGLAKRGRQTSEAEYYARRGIEGEDARFSLVGGGWIVGVRRWSKGARDEWYLWGFGERGFL
jgi:hypothetical protein